MDLDKRIRNHGPGHVKGDDSISGSDGPIHQYLTHGLDTQFVAGSLFEISTNIYCDETEPEQKIPLQFLPPASWIQATMIMVKRIMAIARPAAVPSREPRNVSINTIVVRGFFVLKQ